MSDIYTNLTQQQEIEARLLELKQIAWDGKNDDGDDLGKTNVTTPIISSIYTYVKNYQGEDVDTVPTNIILNINGNQYVINNQDDSDDTIEEEDNKNYNFNLTVPGWFIENPNKAEHFVQDTVTDADFSEISETDEEIPATISINIENSTIDDLKSKQTELNEEYVELEAQRWIDFVKNLIAYINDFEPITVKTVHDGEYQIDATTDFGLITRLDENNIPVYEATSVNTIFITTETVTAPIEEDAAEGEDSLTPPNDEIEEEENTDNIPDNTEIEE